eukprot:TRINITY_DN4213_c0_g1_i1.p1 TRINITY_DN4213_c0_g1~~TRINITY_DN4213_c0_g1_i1.p1  ORF type:complete len:557 (-),score=53.41 TRINITY_DN4213_c0_g1_i1:584-2254(-)
MERGRSNSNHSNSNYSASDAARATMSTSSASNSSGTTSSVPSSPEKPRTAPTSIFQDIGQNLKNRIWNRIRSGSGASSSESSAQIFPDPAVQSDTDDTQDDETDSTKTDEDPLDGLVPRQQQGPTLDEKILNAPEWSNCAVCNDIYKNPVRWKGCEHSFCRQCCHSLLCFGHRHCPLCRRFLPNDCGIDDLAPNVGLVEQLSQLPARCRWAFRATRSTKISHLALASSLPDTVDSLRSRNFSDSPESGSLVGSSGTMFESFVAMNSPTVIPRSTSMTTPGSLSKSLTISSVDELPTSQWQLDPDGCMEVLQLGQLQHHEITCGHKLVPCENRGCGRMFKANSLMQHREECPFGFATCSSCQNKFPRGSISFHEMQCPEAIVECSCGSQMRRAELNPHVANACPIAPVSCSFHGYGCLFVGRRDEARQHESSCFFAALAKPGGYFQRMEQRLTTAEQQISRQGEYIRRLESLIEKQRNEIRSLNSYRRGGGVPGASSSSSSSSSVLDDAADTRVPVPFVQQSLLGSSLPSNIHFLQHQQDDTTDDSSDSFQLQMFSF